MIRRVYQRARHIRQLFLEPKKECSMRKPIATSSTTLLFCSVQEQSAWAIPVQATLLA
jgi:hypothetical protein